jgi:hypothetical protein
LALRIKHEFALAAFDAAIAANAGAFGFKVVTADANAAFAAHVAAAKHHILYGHKLEGSPCVRCQRLQIPNGLPTLEDRRRANARRGLNLRVVPERGGVLYGKSPTHIIVDDIEAFTDATNTAARQRLADAIVLALATSNATRS